LIIAANQSINQSIKAGTSRTLGSEDDGGEGDAAPIGSVKSDPCESDQSLCVGQRQDGAFAGQLRKTKGRRRRSIRPMHAHHGRERGGAEEAHLLHFENGIDELVDGPMAWDAA